MTILITDRITGESYEAHSVDDCRDWADAILYRMAEAYGKPEVTSYGSAEIVEG